MTATCPECDARVRVPDGFKVIECGGCGSKLNRTGRALVVRPVRVASGRADRVERKPPPVFPTTLDAGGRLVFVCMGCDQPIAWNDPYCYGSRTKGQARRTRAKCLDFSDHSHQSKSAYGVTREWGTRRAGTYDVVERGYLCHDCRTLDPTWVSRERK